MVLARYRGVPGGWTWLALLAVSLGSPLWAARRSADPTSGLSQRDWSQIRRSIRDTNHRAAHQFTHVAELVGRDEPGGQAGEYFGCSVAASGDTLVVGTFGDQLAGGNKGSAYVFVRSGASWTEQQKLLASDGAFADMFGWSVAISGDTAVVGAPQAGTGTVAYAGAAYVFVRSGSSWTEQQRLEAPDAATGGRFGYTVSISGDTLVVGAFPWQGSGAVGAAYVFVRSGTTWSGEQKLVASDTATDDGFGFSVSVSANSAAIGAPFKNAGTGAAYVFERSATTWSEQAKLVALDAAADDSFGRSVSISADTVVAGSPYADAGFGNEGAAYVFIRSGTTWSEQQKLLAPGGVSGEGLGYSVAISGDTVALGTPFDSESGSAHVFTRSVTTWSHEAKLTPSDGAVGDWFGAAVSISGDTVVAGASADDVVAKDAGSASVFHRTGISWSEEAKFLAPDGEIQDGFGWSVAASGDTVIVGVPWDDTLAGADAGTLYVFVRSATGWSEQAKLLASDEVQHAGLGWAVSVSGDTAVASAPHASTGMAPGSVYVFVRSGTTWSEQAKLTASDGAVGDRFGRSVSISDDGLVVSAFNEAVYVFVRAGSAWSEQQKLSAADGDPGDSFGAAVSISGESVLVGSPNADTPAGNGAGAAYVFARSGVVWSPQAKLVASDGVAGERFGEAVSIDGDDAAVGSPNHVSAGVARGATYVFVRSGTLWSQQQELWPSDGASYDQFGSSVAVFGDDVVIGAPRADGPFGTDSGAAYVFARSGTAWNEERKLLPQDGDAGEVFGYSVSISGSAAVVSAILDAGGMLDAGSAHVFQRTTSDLGVIKTDGVATAIPGGNVTYTLTVTNAGPDDLGGGTLSDPFPSVLTCTTTCSGTGGALCTPGPFTGDIADTISLPVGQSVAYTSICAVSAAATGSLVNTVTVTAPPGTDPNPANDSATDVDALTPHGDLRVTKTDGQSHVSPGSALMYTIAASNLGPSDVAGATVADAFPSALTGVTWTCSASGGAVCGSVGGSGDIGQAVNLPVGGSVTFEAAALVAPTATGTLVNTATGTSPTGVIDPDPSNNSATDVDNLTLAGLSELVHGSTRVRSLDSTGPRAPSNLFRIRQEPRSSYETVVDGVTGDIASGAGPLLQRLGPDASTVVQTATAAGAGGSRSLRFENTASVAQESEFIRVESAGCTAACGSEDVYRVRLWDTTYSVARFNNTGSQVTVLLLENSSPSTVSGNVWLWGSAGALLGSQGFDLEPGTVLILNTSSMAPGTSGSITVSNDGPYGGLAGKAVSLEPATGFAFDTVMLQRPR